MKIAIAGAGAMGSRFGFMLHKSGNEIVLIDRWEAHINAINENGLKVDHNGQLVHYHIPASYPEDTKGTFDVIILFTKTMQLDAMMNAIQHLITPNTLVVTLLNGLGNIEVIEKYVKRDHIIAGVTIWSSELHGPGHIEATGSGTIELQLLSNQDNPQFNALIETLKDAELFPIVSDDVVHSIWKKAAFNSVLNTYCSLLDCNVGQFGSTQNHQELTEYVLDEFIAVAQAEGVSLNKADILAMINHVFDPEMSGDHFPSMVQDLHKHRKTEIDYLNGAIMTMGRKHAIPTPYCTILTALIHAREDVINAQ